MEHDSGIDDDRAANYRDLRRAPALYHQRAGGWLSQGVMRRSRHAEELELHGAPARQRDEGADKHAAPQPGVALAGDLELRRRPRVEASIRLGHDQASVCHPHQHPIVRAQRERAQTSATPSGRVRFQSAPPDTTSPRIAGPSKLPPVIG